MNPSSTPGPRGLVPTLLATATLLVGCAPPPAAPPPIPSVYVSTVRNDGGVSQRRLFGSVRARVESDLGFRTGGLVAARLVELGQAVRAGQPLARLDPQDLRLALQAAAEQQRAAEVDAVQAASDAARFQRLLADGSVGAADAERQQARADAAAARLTQARQQTDLARNRAAYAELKAPFDGVVTAVRFETGQVVGEGQVVLSLARPGELEVLADVPEGLSAGLAGWQASARLGGSDGTAPAALQNLPLRLRELAPSANAATRTYRARYTLPALPAGAGLRLGMTAEVQLTRPEGMPAAELPLGALLVTNAQGGAADSATARPAVWLVDARSGTLTRRAVQLQSQTTDRVRVAGLPDGAWVVTSGAQKLDAGLTVRPVPRPLEAAP